MSIKLKNMSIMILAVAAALYFTSCAAVEPSKQDESGSLEEQTEQDILKLLGVEEEEKAEEMSEENKEVDLTTRLTELEQMVYEKNSEINELKSELVLKDERIDALQSQLKQKSMQGNAGSMKLNKSDYADLYNVALNNYYARKYKEAIQQFNDLLAVDMNNDLSDNCQYWIGECYYALRDFKKAIVEFEKVFTFSKNNKEDDAQLKLGLCYINLRDKERAEVELKRLLTNYPKSEYIPKAQTLLNNL